MIISRLKMAGVAIAGSALIGLISLAYWLYQDNQTLASEAQGLKQTNADLAASAENQKAVADDFAADMITRDELARRAIDARELADEKLNRVRKQLNDALEADRCAREPHPTAVGDWLRKNSDGL